MVRIGDIESLVQAWLNDVVVGLNLCPFARRPFENQQVRLVTELSTSYDDILARVLAELQFLEGASPDKVETTLVVIPNALLEFNDYLDCLDDINHMLEIEGFEGIVQVASFHPDYQFEGTTPCDVSNNTNRSPFPVFHLIREQSLEQALSAYPNSEGIPERNMELMESLSEARLLSLFPWLYKGK